MSDEPSLSPPPDGALPVIETGVPDPSRQATIQRILLATLPRMSAGDSVFVPGRPNSIRPLMQRVGFRRPQYTTRTVEGGIRIWRTEAA